MEEPSRPPLPRSSPDDSPAPSPDHPAPTSTPSSSAFLAVSQQLPGEASLISLSSDTSTSTPTASTTLRFPKPEGSHLLAHWVKSSSADPSAEPNTATSSAPDANMAHASASDDGNSLADSTYELISSTDGESQDGRGPDSLADSLDLYPRADDVQSLSGNDTGYEDDEESTFHEDRDDEDGPAAGDSSHTQPRNTPNQSFHLAGSGHIRNGDTDDDDEDNDAGTDRRSSQTDSIRYAEHVLGTPSAGQSVYEAASEHGGYPTSPLVQSIEFSEAEVSVRLEKVSVKHTIRKFSEEEAAAIAKEMHMDTPPSRLVATIRQTMAHHCLSTREPLRVLYTGSEGGYNDIMYKISSALLASTGARSNSSSTASSSGKSSSSDSSHPSIYNIMPISAFGSTKVPEIDEIQLMGVSDYYIRVDRCVRADEVVYKGGAFPSDTVYTVTLDNDVTHVSTYWPSGSVVHPQWTLPHLAVFYISPNDDEQVEKTRNAAWEFMTRHAVPSIFISHNQCFSCSPLAGRWKDFVDQAAVHMCLESREPGHSIVPERLPIDLTSFLNIDARQMNRNLAYLTGLQDYDSPDEEKKAIAANNGGVLHHLGETLRLVRNGRNPGNELFRTMHAVREQAPPLAQHWKTLLMALVSTFIWVFIIMSPGLLPASELLPFSSRVVTLSPQPMSTLGLSRTPIVLVPSIPPASSAANSVCSPPSQTPTVTISLTSTKTVKLRVTESTTTAATTTAHFGGFLTDKSHQQQEQQHKQRQGNLLGDTEIKRPGCSIQLYSNHEILVKVPSATKTTWLARGAIDIDVWRGHELLKSKLSTTDEGIIIEIPKKDAHGVMNVSIVTTRRPKINETFAVDFGQPTVVKLLEAGAGLWWSSMQTLADTGRDAAAYAEQAFHAYTKEGDVFPWSAQEVAQEVAEGVSSAAAAAASTLKGGKKHVDQFGQAAAEVARDVSDRARQAVHDGQQLLPLVDKARVDVQEAAQEALAQAKDRLDQTEQVKDAAELSVLRAQITSKLWWLQVQGKAAEHEDYKAKASKFLAEKEKALKAKVKATKAKAAQSKSKSKKTGSCHTKNGCSWGNGRLGRKATKDRCKSGACSSTGFRAKWKKGKMAKKAGRL